MKTLIEKLASGSAAYEAPDADISEKRIALNLVIGEKVDGEISIKGKNEMAIKGAAFSTNSHVTFENNQFNGVRNKIHYVANSKNMLDGEICNGSINIVTTAGDYEIPFTITARKEEISSTIGQISDIQSFIKLVQQSYDEALILFLSKEFKEYLLAGDIYAINMYNQVMKNSNRHIAMEEFMVGMGLKERVKINISHNSREYMDISDNYGDVLNISRSSWGYVDIDVEVQGKFLYNCKTKVSGEDFNGKIAEYQYLINEKHLHAGDNIGRLIFRTSNDTLVFDIKVVNQKNDNKLYIDNKNNTIKLTKNYLQFRTGIIDGTQWKKNMSDIADDMLKDNENNIPAILAKAQIAVLDSNQDQALEYLGQISVMADTHELNSINEYCYYLYIKTLFKNSPDYTDEVKAEIKNYFEGGYDSWQLLWMLFYMDDRYDENPSLKYTLVKRMFNSGCNSPIMYYEAAKVLNDQPELLRILNKFEVQVLSFAGKYNMMTDDLAKQTAKLFEKEKEFNITYINLLAKIYKRTKNKDVLYCICSMIISGNRTEKEYFRWMKEGVKQELNITNLYEYYIYTINTNSLKPLEKSAYKYFSYGTDTLIHNKDYFYANLFANIKENEEIFAKYRDGMEKYVTSEILKGNNNVFLRKIYSKVLTDDFIVGDMLSKMPEVLHTYRIEVKNDNLQKVIVSHKELANSQSTKIVNKVAYVTLYTESPVIVFMDNQGRILSDIPYKKTKMNLECHISKTGENILTRLCDIEKIMKNPAGNQGKLIQLKDVANIPQLSGEFKAKLNDFIIDYYYNNYDCGDLDRYIVQFDMKKLSKTSRDKIMEILIDRDMNETVFPYLVKYGHDGVKITLLEKLCIEMVEKNQYADNEKITEMCAKIFNHGCRNVSVLKYLGKYYQCGSMELYKLFLALQSVSCNDNTLAERLLVQYIFEGSVDTKIYDIYLEYLKASTSSTIRKGFYTYVSYNYFIKKLQCPDIIWEIMEQEYDNGLSTSLICKIAFLEVYSKKDNLTDKQIKITKKLLEQLTKNNVNFEFYKKYDRWFKIPFNLVDKTIIDYRTNPKHRVDITYKINTLEGDTSTVTEEMRSIYQGIFTKEIIMFYGEEIDYSITEYSEEYPQGKIVERSSVRITEKNIYNEENRFGMINGIMICKKLGRDEDAREMMQSYELSKEAGKQLFKLL